MDGGGLGARAAAGHRRRRIPRREIAGESETGATVLGLDCGLAVEVHQGTRNPLGRLAGFGVVLRGSPWRRAALARRRAAFQCFQGLRTTTPSAKRTGEGCRCSPGLDLVGVVAQGARRRRPAARVARSSGRWRCRACSGSWNS